MNMLKIKALENGAHENQTYHGVLPEGWAMLPMDPKTLENFPFGDVTVEEVEGVPTVTGWTPGVMPEPEPEPEPGPTLEERVASLEVQLAETDEAAIELYEAKIAQEAVNAEQDEAIIEIYELIGGTTNG